MDPLKYLLDGNKKFQQTYPTEKLRPMANQQNPKVFWLGCSDSRVSPGLITQTGMGELFVYRNVANQALEKDQGLLAALEYAIEVLNIQHFVVCGHSNCGGVNGAITGQAPHLAKLWLQDMQHWVADFKQTLNQQKISFCNELVEKENIKRQLQKFVRLLPLQKALKNSLELKLLGVYFDISKGQLIPTHEVKQGECYEL